MSKKSVQMFLIMLLIYAADVMANTSIDISINEDIDISLYQIGDADDRLLWLPSGYGIDRTRLKQLTQHIAKEDLQVRIADLHSAYFLSRGRSSLSNVPIADVAALINENFKDLKGKLFLISSERGAALTLMGVRYWQQYYSNSRKISGVILLSPNFVQSDASPESQLEYYSVIDDVQLPIYIFQPESSGKRWYLSRLVKRLNEAGSQVYSQIIDDVGDGFHARENATDIEIEKTLKLPALIKQAVNLLSMVNIKPDQRESFVENVLVIPRVNYDLTTVSSSDIAGDLVLSDLNGKSISLQETRGSVVLLNFWATWCPPCVEEIPSLNRLQEKMKDKNFNLLSINISESSKQVNSFLKKIPAYFPVLMDTEGTTVSKWQLKAFPTSFLIDKKGYIRYSYVGGLDWDHQSIIDLVDTLVNE